MQMGVNYEKEHLPSNSIDADSHLGGSQITLGFAVHQLSKNQCGNELNDKGKTGRIQNGEYVFRSTPVILVDWETSCQIVSHTCQKLE